MIQNLIQSIILCTSYRQLLFCFVFTSCRTVVPYAFVDVDRIKSVRGVYVATQLTPGPVGRRHLLSLITYNNGGKWQRIRSPTVDNRGVKINCYLVNIMILFVIVILYHLIDGKLAEM